MKRQLLPALLLSLSLAFISSQYLDAQVKTGIEVLTDRNFEMPGKAFQFPCAVAAYQRLRSQFGPLSGLSPCLSYPTL